MESNDEAVKEATSAMTADPTRIMTEPASQAEWLQREFARLMRREAMLRSQAPSAPPPSVPQTHFPTAARWGDE